MSYTIGTNESGEPFITCDTCGMTSYHKEDIRTKFCGKCNKFHDDAKEGLYLLPCAPDVCQECAVDHEPWQAHNQQSLYYQYYFYAQHHRWPTWEDAIAHCPTEIQDQWRKHLREMGVKI